MSTADPALQQFRVGIDRIDQRLVRLLNRRAELTIDQLQRTDSDGAGPIPYHDLEFDVLKTVMVRNQGPIPNSALTGIYREILSGAYELARRTRVGYLGPVATFSHQAATQYFGDHVDYENLRTLEGVFEEVSRGHVDYGLVPIENSIGGAIIETLDSFPSYVGRVTICGEVRLPIRFGLFGNCPPTNIKKIYSKAEALAQCYNWIAETYPDALRIPYESTAAAVELAYLADPGDGIAAVASNIAGKRYGLKPLFEGIETRHDNMTRFLVLGRQPTSVTGNDKTSLMFTCADQPGSLVEILTVFKRNAINLSHIEKRPSREIGSEYTFFVDMLGHAREGQTAEILGEVRAHCKTLIVLGSFPVYNESFRYQPPRLITPCDSWATLEKETQSVDAELIEVVNDRAKLVVKVGEFKRKSDVPIYAPHRESAVLLKIKNLNAGPLRNRTLESIYRELMSGSFRLEKPLRIGFAGPVGEFAHVAAVRHFGSSVDFLPAREIRTVFQSVVDGEIDYGLVPIENSSTGGVNSTLDSFFDFHQSINIYGEVKLEIRLALLADCKPEAVQKIYAKPAMFAQCRNWLNTQYPHAARISTESTAAATQAAKAANEADADAGAATIGSALAGEMEGLRPLFEGIEDRQSNLTRFIILALSRTEISSNDKTSIMFTTPDQSGALVDVLEVFKRNAINLTHIEKRPSGETHWDYTFFVDLEGHRDDPRIAEIIGEARAHCKNLTVLGSFPACQRVL
jgi:chorismate mutase/prephenate dehydratase